MMKEIFIHLGWILPTGLVLLILYCLYQESKKPAK